jgi:hypothetical protein
MTERRLGPGLPIFILLAGSIIPAVAEMQILESNVPHLKLANVLRMQMNWLCRREDG